MRTIVAMVGVLALACQKGGQEAPAAGGARVAGAQAPAASTAQARVGSAAFHLEIGGVYERFQDLTTAGEHFSQAVKSAESSIQRAQAYSGLGRVRETGGNKEAAIDAFQHALAEVDGGGSGASPHGPALGMALGGDVVARLGNLYSEKGRYDDAERLYERQLAAAADPWQREHVYRLEVELYRKSGALERKIAEKEKALERSPEDEPALRFLASAFGGAAAVAPASPDGPSGQRHDASRQIGVYERLYRLHPEDMQLRQTLQALLEQAGRAEEAVKLAATPARATQTQCLGAQATPASSPALQVMAETARIRMRAHQDEAALAATAKLAGLGGREGGVAATLLASQLYLEQGMPDRARQMVAQASRRARSPEERQQVAFAREQELARSGQAAELKALYDDWRRSDDACLRLTSAQRQQQMVVSASPGTAQPPRTRL